MPKTVFIDGVELPVVKNCDNCCACCMEQGSPPGFLMAASGYYKPENSFVDERDRKRFETMPKKARKIIDEYLERLRDDDDPTNGEEPCCWLDLTTGECQYHRYRPQICRDFKVNSEECHGWRDEYNVFYSG